MRLAYTVSSAFIKVWDLRMNPSSCIKTLSSSGLTTNGPVVLNNPQTNTRTLAMPPGETQINDICLTPSGYGLFSAAGDKVRDENGYLGISGVVGKPSLQGDSFTLDKRILYNLQSILFLPELYRNLPMVIRIHCYPNLILL